MSLYDRIKRAFGVKPQGPTIRNRPGGLAWIRPYGQSHGADKLAGRVVRTVSLVEGEYWEIDPPQRYVVAGGAIHCPVTGITAYPGTPVLLTGLADDLLEPIPQVGDQERDQSAAWLPQVPALSKEPVRV